MSSEALEPPRLPSLRLAESTRLVLWLGIVIGIAGCTGGASEPTSQEDQLPVPTVVDTGKSSASSTPKAEDGLGVQHLPSGSESSLPTAEQIKNNQAALEAFRALIDPASEPATWDAAQQQLVALGSDAVPVLVSGLQSDNPIERETAATVCALRGVTDPRLQKALVERLDDSSSFVRANAAAALAQLPEFQAQAVATLTNLLADSDPQLRRMAAANLGSFGEEASAELPKLTAVLTDDDAEVVTPVIHLLGRIGPSAVEAVPQLQKIAFEQDGELKQAAEQALLLIQADATGNSKSGE